ncbi:hypothetical protein E4U56_005152 [Claviceps arundinis]|uniref:non-specific serine/threonine protein kinase n=1 Tax=Claviceps arundinis TaxID=1623583 RepID=A0A9P7SKU5_9HYPO|nr:hypothetical protein E4U56_005152 [Claviceps arundinis]
MSVSSASSLPIVQWDDIEYDVEDVQDWEARGKIMGDYYPIDIDNRLNERYRIVQKLGHGPWSTVWLAIDEETRKYVAIKVGIAQSDGNEGKILTEISQSLSKSDVSKDKKLMIPTVLDQFEIHGRKGTHPCLVTLPARCNLEEAQHNSSPSIFQLDVARSLAAQLVIAVSIVHEKGYAHGDLHLKNFLLQLPSSLDDLSVEELYETYGKPVKCRVEYPESEAVLPDLSVPTYLVCPACLIVPGHEITLAEAKLTLSDFGAAFRPADESRLVSLSHVCPALRPPEALFEPQRPLNFASDIWSLACLILPLFGFDAHIDNPIERAGEIIVRQIGLSGPMPPAWWRKWEQRPIWFTENGEPTSLARQTWTWEGLFEWLVQQPRRTNEMETLAEDEMAALTKLLRDMLAWKPCERPNISKVLKSDWMTRWALPAYQKGLEKQEDVKESEGLEVPSDLQAPKDTRMTGKKRKA